VLTGALCNRTRRSAARRVQRGLHSRGGLGPAFRPHHHCRRSTRLLQCATCPNTDPPRPAPTTTHITHDARRTQRVFFLNAYPSGNGHSAHRVPPRYECSIGCSCSAFAIGGSRGPMGQSMPHMLLLFTHWQHCGVRSVGAASAFSRGRQRGSPSYEAYGEHRRHYEPLRCTYGQQETRRVQTDGQRNPSIAI
jgi:hypothetical protein